MFWESCSQQYSTETAVPGIKPGLPAGKVCTQSFVPYLADCFNILKNKIPEIQSNQEMNMKHMFMEAGLGSRNYRKDGVFSWLKCEKLQSAQPCLILT